MIRLVPLLILLVGWPFSRAIAAQYAVVLREKAIVYADQQMTSPLGYVARGKRIRVGEIPRNQGQVYPTLISGKIAYIKVTDVSTETKSVNGQLVAERFTRNAEVKHQYTYSASYLYFHSNVHLNAENGTLKKNDPMGWNGISVTGGVDINQAIDTKVIFNYMQAQKGDEKFRATELGLGVGFKFIDQKRFLMEWEIDGLLSPYAQYALGSKFRINGYGYTAGTGLNFLFKTGEHWGISALTGFYYTKLMGFNVPSPYKDIAPSFTGLRFALGASYSY